MGFTWVRDEHCPSPKCIVCDETLANEAMVPGKLKRHLSAKHGYLSDKGLGYFERHLRDSKRQMVVFEKHTKTSNAAQEASYLVAEFIAKYMKPHTIAESLILPACCAIVQKMLGTEAVA